MNTGGNFDGIAPFYDTLAFVVFGRRLQKAQLVWLNRIPTGASVLMVGGGTGWLLEQVLIRCQPKRVVYIEASLEMLARASRRVLRHSLIGSVDFRAGNETALQSDEQFDVLITPFVLDLFTEKTLRSTFIPRLQHVLKATGLWLISDFVKPTLWWQKGLLWLMIHFFRLASGIEAKTLPDWQRLLTETGMVRYEQRSQVGGMVSAEVWIQSTRVNG